MMSGAYRAAPGVVKREAIEGNTSSRTQPLIPGLVYNVSTSLFSIRTSRPMSKIVQRTSEVIAGSTAQLITKSARQREIALEFKSPT
ncbi:hypothetical protein [Mycobacterium pseudokansasii]|uniref:hypothetical protein n=1 Tax=Mycobacterium pseudokansasii TaxID=2341080 RepID=UPI0010A95759|nr:hypothetical protein [Mycobacterium pseudokansasii]